MVAAAGVRLTDLALIGDVTFVPLVLSLTLAGIGFGVAVVPITSVALSSLPAKHSGMAASATTTSREVGTVLGVAVLGSLFNTQLIDYLTRRLVELEVPPEFREFIITMVLTGQSSSSAAEAEALYGPIVGRVVAAAFDAVHSGVSTSLLVAGVVIFISGIIAWVSFSPKRLAAE